jgi:hypothetical protein
MPDQKLNDIAEALDNIDEALEKKVARVDRRHMYRMILLYMVPTAIILFGVFYYSNYLSTQRANDRLQEEKANVINQRKGCERGNTGIRQPIYNFFTDAIQTRLESAKVDTGIARATDLQAARAYRQDRDSMVTSVADVAQAPGSPLINCNKAYPLP